MENANQISAKTHALRGSREFIENLSKKLDSEDYQPLDITNVVTGLDLAVYLSQGQNYPFLPLHIISYINDYCFMPESKLVRSSTDLDTFYLEAKVGMDDQRDINRLSAYLSGLMIKGSYKTETLQFICDRLKSYIDDYLCDLRIKDLKGLSISLGSLHCLKLNDIFIVMKLDGKKYKLYVSLVEHFNDNTCESYVGVITFKDDVNLLGKPFLNSALRFNTKMAESIIAMLNYNLVRSEWFKIDEDYLPASPLPNIVSNYRVINRSAKPVSRILPD